MTTPSPAFSVVVPTYERPASLARCLDALAAQTLDHDRFEVIVVDDGSAEPPRAVVARAAASIDVRLVEQANAGPATARNAGAEASRGRYVVFTDDDCRPDPEWLSAIDVTAARHPGFHRAIFSVRLTVYNLARRTAPIASASVKRSQPGARVQRKSRAFA